MNLLRQSLMKAVGRRFVKMNSEREACSKLSPQGTLVLIPSQTLFASGRQIGACLVEYFIVPSFTLLFYHPT
jgi:hypothetical protein